MSEPATADLDIARVDAADYPHRSLEAVEGRGGGFQAVIRRGVLNEIHRHGEATPEVEICGVLVGNVYRDPSGPYLLIDASIRGDAADNHAAQVTFKAETWQKIQAVMDRDHPDSRIVGWYHTHPGFGIFLSGMDLFIQDNFFNLPWQVAFVYDPVAAEEGMFFWRQGKAERGEFLIDESLSEGEAHAAESDAQAKLEKQEALADRLRFSNRAKNFAASIPPRLAAAIVIGIFLVSFFIASAMLTYRQLNGDGTPAPNASAEAGKQ
jgi:proteasome lid subunit RPN8/RPN11